MQQITLEPWNGFSEVLLWGLSLQSVNKFEFSLESEQNTGKFTWRPHYLQKQKRFEKHILYLIIFFRKACGLIDEP
jgi:hypothetical protein